MPHRPRQGLRVPQSQHSFFPASVHITSPHLASTLLAAARLPPESEERHGVPGRDLGFGPGGGLAPADSAQALGMVGARGGRLHPLSSTPGPLAQAGRPPKPSPWASRLGRGRGRDGEMGRAADRGEEGRESRKRLEKKDRDREGEEGGENRNNSSWKNQKVARNGKL